MAVGRLVVSVSELRRRLATLIYDLERDEHPLFITQYGCVCAVLISRRQYDDWCPDGEHRRYEGQRCRDDRELRERASALAGQHRRRPGYSVVPERKVWTQYGWCDFEVAQVLAEQGVDTELVPTAEGWFTDDEG
jgi:hypothetical protein